MNIKPYYKYKNDEPIPVLADLIGKTLVSVQNIDDDYLVFDTGEKKYALYHKQDCCESVTIADITGDLSDLIGEPILVAEEVSNYEAPPQNPNDAKWGSYTWTFYKFATRKGYVDVRWYGTSNGYYSESVDFGVVLP